MCKKCVTKYCRGTAKKGRYCCRCTTENRKRKNPYLYWFGVYRTNANRRARLAGNEKFWCVTYEYWVQFCDETGFLAIKGRRKHDASLDCIINELGYIDGNIRPLTVGDNAAKGVKYPDYNPVTGEWDLVTWAPTSEPEPTDLPF